MLLAPDDLLPPGPERWTRATVSEAWQACRRALAEGVDPETVDEEWLSRHMALSFAPDPDLFIRTGGEMRMSNFLLWQAAYSELFFTQRDRRFGGIRPQPVVREDR